MNNSKRTHAPKHTLALQLAVAGLVAGLGAACTAETKPAPQKGTGAVSTDPTALARHACKGFNSCKGQGGCKSGDNGCKAKNSCKGKGGCATVAHHSCAGQNECKALGGCGGGDNGCKAKNSCKGKGGCAVPIVH